MKKIYHALIFIILVFGIISFVSAQSNTEEKIRKCGVNTFSIWNDCGVSAYRFAYWQCHDGYEEKHEDQTSCKPAEVWSKYAQQSCENRCGGSNIPKPSTKPSEIIKPAPTSVAASPTAVPVCYISDNLLKEYHALISELKKVEGNEEKAKEITERIIKLKKEIERNQIECLKPTAVDVQNVQPPTVVSTTQSRPTITETDKCKHIEAWENKIGYYKKLSSLSDPELKKEGGFSREEINRILSELNSGLQKLKEECKMGVPSDQSQVSTKPATAVSIVRPVVADSGHEIDIYYRSKLEKIASMGNIDEQIKEMKGLREEIDNLIERLLKSKKEIGAAEISGLVDEIEIGSGKIKADNVDIDATGKNILIDVGTNQVSIQPAEKQVIIMDKGVEVTADRVSIKGNSLRVGNSEVNLGASDVVDKLKITPKSIELKEENSKAVYKIKTEEDRKLLGVINVKVEKDLTVDAGDAEGKIISEDLPWWGFLTSEVP